jgi:hypothetical protein
MSFSSLSFSVPSVCLCVGSGGLTGHVSSYPVCACWNDNWLLEVAMIAVRLNVPRERQRDSEHESVHSR